MQPKRPLPCVQITRREEFSAAHRLHDPRLSDEQNRRIYGVCNNPNGHGHNYTLEVTLEGEVSDSGMVMDLNRLGLLLQEEVVRELDHKHLNHDVPFLEGINPTAENVVIVIWARLAARLDEEPGCRLHRIRLFESRKNFVEYYGPNA